MLIVVLCIFSAPFGKSFPKVISSLFCPLALNVDRTVVTVIPDADKFGREAAL